MATEFSSEVLNSLEKFNQETVKIEPVNSGLVKNPDQEDANYWNIARDMALSAPQGVFNAIEEQGDFLDENIISLGGLEFGDKDGKLTFKDFIPTSLISTLSNLIFPLEGSKNLGIKSAIVDFPDPLAPTNATTDPFFTKISCS